MATRKFFIFNLFLLTCLLSVPVQSAPGFLKSLEEKPAPVFKIPQIQRNKITPSFELLFLEDHELPVLRGFLYFRTGSVYESSENRGLASLTAELLRSGGTAQHPPEQIDQMLDAMGAEISIKVTREYGLLSFQCLREDFDKTLSLVFEILSEPAFDENRFQLAKAQMIQQIRSQQDEPDELAMREFPKLVLGKESPWARTASEKSVAAISRQDLLDFYQNSFFSDKILAAVAGDIKADVLFSKVKQEYSQALSGKQKWVDSSCGKKDEAMCSPSDSSSETLFSNKTPPVIPAMQKSFSGQTAFLAKKTDQTTLLLGHFGDKRTNPDKYALLLLNEILGGDAMNSRLGQKIRSDLGLAYTVQSRFGLEKDFGVFWIFTQTKNSTTDQALREIQKQLSALVSGNDLTEQELEFHRLSLLNSLYSQYEPLYNFIKEEGRFEFLDYPPNYLETFRQEIEKVKLEDLQRVARQYFHPEALKILIVGDPDKLGPDLKKSVWNLE